MTDPDLLDEIIKRILVIRSATQRQIILLNNQPCDFSDIVHPKETKYIRYVIVLWSNQSFLRLESDT